MFGKKTPLELARLELEAFRKRAVKLDALHRAEATVGADAFLDGGDAAISKAADSLARTAAEVRLVEAGIRGLRKQRATALTIELRRQAEALRKQAVEKMGGGRPAAHRERDTGHKGANGAMPTATAVSEKLPRMGCRSAVLEEPEHVPNPRMIGHQELVGEIDLSIRFDSRDDVVSVLHYAEGNLSLLEVIWYNFPEPVPRQWIELSRDVRVGG